MEILKITSSVDKTLQPSIFIKAKGDNRPLLVALHTWSFDMYNQLDFLLPYIEKENWNLLLPNFRGANKPSNPECKDACGSEKAINDILDATLYVIDNYPVDSSSVYLFGGSGGGQAALLTVAYQPSLWTSAVAYVPIFDLKCWLDENIEKNADFANDIIACAGEYESSKDEYKKRSPISYIDRIAEAKDLKIFSGKFDTIVNIEQTVMFYNALMAKHPRSKVFLEIFDGDHYVNYRKVIEYFKKVDEIDTIDLSK